VIQKIQVKMLEMPVLHPVSSVSSQEGQGGSPLVLKKIPLTSEIFGKIFDENPAQYLPICCQ